MIISKPGHTGIFFTPKAAIAIDLMIAPVTGVSWESECGQPIVKLPYGETTHG